MHKSRLEANGSSLTFIVGSSINSSLALWITWYFQNYYAGFILWCLNTLYCWANKVLLSKEHIGLLVLKYQVIYCFWTTLCCTWKIGTAIWLYIYVVSGCKIWTDNKKHDTTMQRFQVVRLAGRRPGRLIGCSKSYFGCSKSYFGSVARYFVLDVDISVSYLDISVFCLHISVSGLHISVSGLHISVSCLHISVSGLHVSVSHFVFRFSATHSFFLFGLSP
jgi:hypothetical protein